MKLEISLLLSCKVLFYDFRLCIFLRIDFDTYSENNLIKFEEYPYRQYYIKDYLV